MRIFLIFALLSTFTLIPIPGAGGYYQFSEVITVGDSMEAETNDLQDAFDIAPDNSLIRIESGTFEAVPQEYTDPMCGNCQDPSTDAAASTGFRISGKSLTIFGNGTDETKLVTGAGYGLYIENCPSIKISDLSITGGVRDQDGSATDAAVVVRSSSVEIFNCDIHDNEGDYSVTVAGIGGIMGREGAILNIHDNVIHDNSWDGVALYRGATATVTDNEIYNGRGAGVGITWDSTATVIRNNIHDYWKGIGSFGNTRVGVYNNFVHDLRGWGIVATGTSDMICRNNTVINCGNVGIAGWNEEAKIEIVNNVISDNGGIERWVAPRVGIWMNCIEGNYKIAYNLIYNNYDAGVAFGYEEFDDETWGFSEIRNYYGVDGNMGFDMFNENGELHSHEVLSFSDNGDPEVLDLDGTRSDIGWLGGPFGFILPTRGEIFPRF